MKAVFCVMIVNMIIEVPAIGLNDQMQGNVLIIGEDKHEILSNLSGCKR
jgi:hypothetical protein